MAKIVSLLTVLGLVLGGFVVPTAYAATTTTVYESHLNGSEEVPPVSTDAEGHFELEFTDDDMNTGTSSDDELTADYTLRLSDIEDVTMAHLHCGDDGEVGPPIVTLFDFGSNTQDFEDDEVDLADMSINDDDVMDDDECDFNNLSDLMSGIEDGEVYINVHTTDHPEGEIRGQLAIADGDDDDEDDNGNDDDDNQDDDNGNDDDQDDDDDQDNDDNSTSTPGEITENELQLVDQLAAIYYQLLATIRSLLGEVSEFQLP